MLAASLLGVCAAAAATPVLEGRDLHAVADPVLEGDGPGGGLFADARGLGAVDASLGGVAAVGWTFRPLRLAVALPGEAGTAYIVGGPPRLDALFVLSDRRRGGLGVAATVDLPLPFVRGPQPLGTARLALGVGRAHTAFVVNLGAPLGPALESVSWSAGGAAPLVGPLSAFAELEGSFPVDTDAHAVGTPALSTVRAGFHLSPTRPLVLGFAITGAPSSPHPAFVGTAVWIPQERGRGARPPPDTQAKVPRVDTRQAAR